MDDVPLEVLVGCGSKLFLLLGNHGQALVLLGQIVRVHQFNRHRSNLFSASLGRVLPTITASPDA